MAKNTIKQRIALEGGKDILSDLKAMGKEGEKAFDAIRAAAVKVNLQKFRDDLGKFGSDLQRVGRRAALAFAAIAAGAAGTAAALYKIAKVGTEAADESGKAAQAAGLQVEAYGRLAFAASQSAVSQEELRSGFQRLNRTIGEVVDGSQRAIDAFKAVGVSIYDSAGKVRPTEDIIHSLADAFAAMPDSATKSAAAMELFGRSGAQLIPFLNSGSAGLIELGKRAEDLGIVFTKQQYTIAAAMNDTLDDVSRAVQGITAQIGLLFAPAITAGAEALRDTLIENRAAIVDFGQSLAAYGIGYLRDFLNLLLGRDSQVRAQWLVDLRDGIVGFGRDLKSVYDGILKPVFSGIAEAGNLVAEALNSVFGTDLTGRQVLIAAFFAKILGLFSLAASSAAVLASGIRLVGSAIAFAFSGGAIASVGRLFGLLVSGASAFVPFIAGLIGWPALIVAAVVAAGVAIYAFWDDIKTAAAQAYQAIAGFFSADAFSRLVAGLGDIGRAAGDLFIGGIKAALDLGATIVKGWFDLVTGFWLELGRGALAAFAAIGDGLLLLAQAFGVTFASIGELGRNAWLGLVDAATVAWSAITTGASGVFDTVANIFSAGAQTVGNTFAAVADLVSNIWETATGGIVAAANAIVDAIATARDLAGDIAGAEKIADALVAPFVKAEASIREVFDAIATLAKEGFDRVKSIVSSAASSIESMISRILASLRAAAAEARRLKAEASSSSGGSGFAGGGHVRGPGTGTSDSIPAWLSNGEFVMRAAAVRRYGLAFLTAINRGLLPLRNLRGGLGSHDLAQVLGKVNRFSAGGLVTAATASLSHFAPATPRFAAGGAVAAPAGVSGRPLVLQLGGESFDLVAEESVAQKLERYAIGRSLRSSGRSPSHGG